MRIIIIGAGPTGLGAAYHLDQCGINSWQIFERNDHVGGLCSSIYDNAGFTWDLGGHVMFSHYAYFDRVIAETLGNDYYEHVRESWIHLLDRWVPYPFQNNIRYLPPQALQECIEGLRSVAGFAADARNFADWIQNLFGSGISKYFLVPYNQKVWGVPLETMSKDWVAERVSRVDFDRIQKNVAEGLDDVDWGANNTFRFPKKGGTGAIFTRIAGALKGSIHLNHELVSVDVEQKQIMFSNGRCERYDVLINTSPINTFLVNCSPIPEKLISTAAELVHNSCQIVGLGLQGTRQDKRCWMYFPESTCPFYRVTNFDNYSPYNVPGAKSDQYFSLLCETTYSSYRTIDQSKIVADTLEGLIHVGLLDESHRQSIVSRSVIDLPYSYPVPTLGRDRALANILPFLEGKEVYSRGRFGAWKYEVGNMDHSFMQGVEVVDRILFSGLEPTLNKTAPVP